MGGEQHGDNKSWTWGDWWEGNSMVIIRAGHEVIGGRGTAW